MVSLVTLEFEEYQQIRTALARAEGALMAVEAALEIHEPDRIDLDGLREQERQVTAARNTLAAAYRRTLDGG